MRQMISQNQDVKNCIQECLSCYSVCIETIQHCLTKGGNHARPDHIELLSSCAEICRTSAHFMLSSSEYHPRTCAVCAEVCDACEKSCNEFADDEQMRHCAEACRSCAESCRRMSGGTSRVAA